MFAVVDIETTGLMPERNDRVIEIAVVLMDDKARIEQEWTTLVNPRRDVGATHIHGICAGDILDAPEFGDVADQFLGLITGRAVVAHNASFDMRFLHAELNRAGYAISSHPPALCSMKWSGRLVGPAKLQHVCEALNVKLTDAHSAMGDARATAEVLIHLTQMAKHESEWINDIDHSRYYGWPALRGKPDVETIARNSPKSNQKSWLDSVLSAAWIPGIPEDEASYLLALERALLDRNISISEERQLIDTAKSASLSGNTVARIHRSYLLSAAQEALADDVVTDAEKDDLISIADMLGIKRSEVDIALANAAEDQSQKKNQDSFSLTEGDRIVFTGETSKPREVWLAEIISAGLVSGGINKSTKLVIAADPDSLSGKAVKARDYGIPIVDEKTFARLLQIYKERR